MLRNFTGSTGVRAVIAVLMLLFVVACAGSDSGIKRERDEARAAAEAAEQARLAAEEQARKDAEAAAAAAAAAAEQARKDAEAAAAAAAEQARMEAEAAQTAAYERAKAAIAAAETAAAAQAAYDAEKENVNAAQGEMLQAAVDERTAALATMARAAEQRMALMSAAGMIDTSDLSTQALVDAAQAGIRALRQAIANAVDVDDTSMYQTMLDDAVADVDDAQGGIDTATRRMNQMTALSDASDTLQAALAALSGSTPTQAQLNAANSALAALNSAIAEGEDLTADEKAPYQREATNAVAPISTAQVAFDAAKDEAGKTANAAMAADARKLYSGIAAPTGDPNSPAATDRAAAYNDVDVPTSGTAVDTRIVVSIGNGTDMPTAVALSEDKKTTVADNVGWEGKRYAAEPDDDGTYEAMVYSNVGEPTQGQKFDVLYTVLDGTTGELVIDTTTDTDIQSRVASSSFDQSAGVKTFELGDNDRRVRLSGSYHGVSGTYYCTPSGDTICASRVAVDGFQLGTVASATDSTFTAGATGWNFKPTDPDARVMSTPDAIYASYGWWIHKSEDGNTFTASAFADVKGAVPAASALNTLQGTATYMGGAAGKYALSSSTGGTNDAGHFTARATLNADFSDNSIAGTIDQFMGADGMSRPWSVELKEAAVAATGEISRTDNKDTAWTIDGTAAGASGEWDGTLYDNGDDGVPKVGTGTFYTEYGTDGKMVGAFGVNKQ